MIPPLNDMVGLHTAGRTARVATMVCCMAGVCALTVVGAWPAPAGHNAALTPDDVARQFCMPVPAEAQASLGEAPTTGASVVVPNAAPALDAVSPILKVRKGDVVEIVVHSRLAGAVGVHGLSSIYAIHPDESIAVKFRAAYTGRYPLHFHSIDGAHFELIAIEVGEI